MAGDSEKYGGFAGYLYGKIIGCYAVASVTGSNNNLRASYFKGSVACSKTYTGLNAGYVTKSSFGYYSQDGGNVTVATGNNIDFTGFKTVDDWGIVIYDMNSNIGDTYKYKYVWDETKQHPELQATE